MRIGAIITLGDGRPAGTASSTPAGTKTQSAAKTLFGATYVSVDILGKSLLDRNIAKLKAFCTLAPIVISEAAVSGTLLPVPPARSGAFIAAWENAVAHYVREGIDVLLLMRLNAYTDLDYGQLLRFHLQNHADMTQAYGGERPLEIALVNASAWRRSGDAYREQLRVLLRQQHRFAYEGYVNRLRRPRDFHKLALDGLHGLCGLQPEGREVRDGVWCAEGARIDSSTNIAAPVYIGAGSAIASGCEIKGASAIERDCKIDCATSIFQSCILPGTYVGAGLEVRRSVVDGKNLFHVDRNVAIHMEDLRLIGNSRSSLLPRLGSFLWGEAQATE